MILAINKPLGLTSFGVIAVLRRMTGITKIGHAGTLDPWASGVLVVGIGREATKKLAVELAKDKEYSAQITLGTVSDTGDVEGPLHPQSVRTPPSLHHIESALQPFIGEINQRPPQFSAVKLNGRPAYTYARQGQSVALGFHQVTIYAIKLLSYDYPRLTLQVHCGPGVYLRSLASDLGEALGTGAYLSALTRTRVGHFTLDQAIPLNQFKTWFQRFSSKITSGVEI